MIAKIAVSAARFSIDKPYSYRFPDDMALSPGIRVMVPFGSGNRRTEGVVLSVEPGDESGLKSVLQKLDEEPLISSSMLRLAAFLRERYFCTFLDALRAMLPAPLWFRCLERFTLAEGKPWEGKTIRQSDALAILEYLEGVGGEADSEQLKTVISDEERRDKALKYLLNKSGSPRNRTSCAGSATSPSALRPWRSLPRKPWPSPPAAPRGQPCRRRCWSCCAASAAQR